MRIQILTTVIGALLTLCIQAGPLPTRSDPLCTTQTPFGAYQLEKLDYSHNFNGKKLETWLLTYNNTSHPIFIGIERTDTCRNFHIKTMFFEVTYVCQPSSGFGIRPAHESYSSLEPVLFDFITQNEAFKNQLCITKEKHSENYLLSLIAFHLPKLLNSHQFPLSLK